MLKLYGRNIKFRNIRQIVLAQVENWLTVLKPQQSDSACVRLMCVVPILSIKGYIKGEAGGIE